MIDTPEENTAVIVVDVQGDFTFDRKGSLAVAGTDNTYLDLVDSETRRLKALGYPIFATQDWHPEDHMSFHSNHDNRAPYDTIEVDSRVQVLWPPHCVQGTENAEIILDTSLFEAVVRKGMDPDYDSYSGFFDDGGKATGLGELLREKGIKKLIVYGLTTDYCAKFTALDARRLGFEVVLITDLCRGVTEETTRTALEEMKAAGVSFI